ncbi:MAG: hypothetical protein ICV60_11740 [Pyrinomonadaceae bacterium]|nr:hypothetical protein [Pyrinomonadaceae bacterium]
MRTPRLKSLIVVFVLASMLLCGLERPVYACGPFARGAIFNYVKHPDFPLDSFARGQLGVLQPTYARSYLYVAYRYMNGMSFNQSEQQALASLWRDRFVYDWQNSLEEGKTAWFAARKKVRSVVGADPEIEVFRATGKEEYDSFLNCPNDAFESAAHTLEDRIKQFGADSAEVKDWLQGQDKVFSNCGSGEVIPEAATSTAALIRADRAYQIAAAKFYAMKFDEARADFEKIAGDASSPWHETAQYLIARSLIRKASLGEDAKRTETLTQAETALKRTLDEIKQGPLHDSAAKLLNLVKLRLRPEERLRELSASLMNREPNADLKQELWDYTTILDKYLGSEDEPVSDEVKKNQGTVITDELSDWLRTFQAEDKPSYEHALDRWRKTDSHAWLVAALSKASSADAASSSLIDAASRIEPNAAAYATASFHAVRLLIESGKRADARTRLDTILQNQAALPPSAINQFLHQRMLLATTLEEFLKYAQRRPTAFSWGDDGREIPIEPKELNQDADLKQLAGRTLFDEDAAQIMNDRLPLSLLQEAANSPTLPEHLRKRMALAAWTRAVMLNDTETSKALTPVLASLAPEMKASLNEYANAATPASARAVALYTLLKFPGTRPFVDSNVGRFTPLNERDIYRDNWWCDRAPFAESAGDEAVNAGDTSTKRSEPKVEALQLDFLSAAQSEAGKRERTQLLSLGTGPNYLSREAIGWAKRAPNDPRVPEALHIAVMTTRYGCSDKDTGPLSKAAWQLLHTRYKNTAWAKKTPYWFNN